MDGFFDWLNGVDGSGTLRSVLMAAIIVVITAVISFLATRLIRRIMQVDGLPLPSSSIIVNIVRIIIWAIGLSIMLSTCFGVDVNGLIAALGVTGIALSLGLQDTIKNLIGGLQITILGIVHPGDHIIVGAVEGIVQDVSWRQTVVKDFENNIHLIPNSVINATDITKIEPELLIATRLSFINDGHDMDAMIHEMEAAAKQAIEKVAPLEKDPWILLTEIGEYGTWAKLRFVLKDVSHAREARDAALRVLTPYTRNDSTSMLGDGSARD